MPLAFSLLVFTTRLLLPGTFNSTSLKRFRAHAKCQDAQLLQDAQMCDFDGITLRTRWWNVKEKSSHFHGTPVHPRPKPGAAEHQTCPQLDPFDALKRNLNMLCDHFSVLEVSPPLTYSDFH